VKVLYGLLAILLVQACASGTTTVLAPAKSEARFSSASIETGDDTVAVEDGLAEYYEEKLREYLYAEDGFSEGDELTIRYRFIQLDKGSRAARYIIGFGAGKGELTIETVFLDSEGVEVARIQSGGEIAVGFAGGSFREAVAKAAEKTADYARENLLAG